MGASALGRLPRRRIEALARAHRARSVVTQQLAAPAWVALELPLFVVAVAGLAALCVAAVQGSVGLGLGLFARTSWICFLSSVVRVRMTP